MPFPSVAILGASRGLGLAIAEQIFHSNQETPQRLWLSSRTISSVSNNFFFNANASKLTTMHLSNPTLYPSDFTLPDAAEGVLAALKDFKPEQIIYCAGGGPYGPYHEKPWHAHQWAFTLNFIFPAQLLHSLLKDRDSNFSQLKQIIFIGSSVAENKADPGASSYSAAKHGLRGLIQSLREEYNNNSLVDLRLYSPHYMNTSLLPKRALPRQAPSCIDEPIEIAMDLLHWSKQPPSASSWHRVIVRE